MNHAPTTPPTPDHPLGLTVHEMPDPGRTVAPRTSVGRLKMILIFLVCASPVVASYFTYYVVRPEGRRSYGELIDPQRPLPAVEARTIDGPSQPLASLKDQWLLVTVAGAGCEAACQQNLYLQRQLRESLGREKDRVERVWLISDEAPVAESLKPALEGATVLRLPQAQLQAWLAPASGHALSDHLFVVDPLGHWMMRFPAAMDVAGAGKAKKDLERLLRAAKSWDQPGRP